MKYIAFIVLGLVLLTAIAGIVLRANMPTARLTVHAVRPMGTNVTSQGGANEQSYPSYWEFAITNTGRVPAYWSPRFRYEVIGGNIRRDVPWPCDPSNGILPAGQHTLIYMSLPPDGPSLWRAEVEYRTPMNSLETKLSLWLEP